MSTRATGSARKSVAPSEGEDRLDLVTGLTAERAEGSKHGGGTLVGAPGPGTRRGRQGGSRAKLFEYTARRRDGTQISGRELAEDVESLDEQLESQGMLLIRARAIRRGKRSASKKLPRAQLVSFTNQLATMLRAGIPLITALRHLRTRSKSPELGELLDHLIRDLEAGETFHEALERQARSFPAVYRASVRAGEQSTELPEVLRRQAAYLQWVKDIKNSAVQALVYPAILAVAVLVLVVILLTFLVPRLVKLYPGGAADLPRETRLVLGVSDFLAANWMGIVGVSLALGVGFVVALRRPRSRRFLSRQSLRIPRLGEVLRMIATSRFATTASTLHNAGCEMVGTLSMAGATCGSAYLADAFQRVTDRVRRGATITESLEREDGMDPLLVQLVSVGETSGDLGGSLASLAECYDTEVPRAVKWALSLIEPIVIAVGGVIVLFILLAALLPIVKLYEVIA